MSVQPPYPQAIPLSPVDQYLAGHLISVQSDYCVAIAYEPHVAAIVIRYDDGEVWKYFPYSREEALSLWYAPSKGKWAWTFIRVRGTKNQHHRGAVQAS